MLLIVLFMVFCCAAILWYVVVPMIVDRANEINRSRAQTFALKMDKYLQDEELKKAQQLNIYGPIALGIAGFAMFPAEGRIIGLVVGIIIGYIIPRMYVARVISTRKQKFNDQLTDMLMIMSSSFRGGLSLIQAFEAVVDEMPEPAKGEIGIVLGENKMGVALDESLNRLNGRMSSPGIQQMITAILLARETGGNLPVIFSRIISATRERRKIEQNLQMLTIQGKIQAFVMTGLPVFFFVGVSASNPHFFDVMLKTPNGQKLMGLCAILWVLGAASIWKISTFKDV